MDRNEIERIESKIGYVFSNKNLLEKAFTHSSYSNENNAECNEKLEFLGDSILNFIISWYLYDKNPDSEGALSLSRSKIVSAAPLASAIDKLDILQHLLMGNGTLKEQLSEKTKSDLFEALTAAIYLDSGLDKCKRFIFDYLDIENRGLFIDYKTKLQELAQSVFKGQQLEYTSEFDEAAKLFCANAVLDGKVVGTGKGKKKKDAEQEAASAAFNLLKQKSDK